MKKTPFIFSALTAVVLLAGASLAGAADDKTAAPRDGNAGVSAKAASPSKTASAPALAKPIDINKASIKELKNLPGFNDEIAAKIVAGRPYPSKAFLVTRNIIDAELYGTVKQSIVAKQPYKDPKKNAALYANPKK